MLVLNFSLYSAATLLQYNRNTAKYLVSVAPQGIINFVSKRCGVDWQTNILLGIVGICGRFNHWMT